MTAGQRLDGPLMTEAEAVAHARTLEPVDLGVPWRGLTGLEAKATEYWRESPFREALEDATDVLGPSLYGFFQQIATIAFRPEAYAGRRIERAVEFLERHDFRVVHYHLADVTGLQARELWRWQWNVATLDRLAVFDLVAPLAPWMMVVLQDLTDEPTVPASVRLRGLKGSAIAANRGPDTLRSACASPNRILTITHAADEPVDILREIGLFLDQSGRIRWLEEVRAACAGATRWRDSFPATCAELYAQVPEQDFDLGAAVARTAATLRATDLADAAAELEQVHRRQADAHLPFRRWLYGIRDALPDLDIWDVIVVGSALSAHDREGEQCTIDDDGRVEWMTGQGRLEWGRDD